MITIQRSIFALILGMSVLSTSAKAQASGLIIHAAEMGIGKFHRKDDQVHPYAETNAWKSFVLDPSVNPRTQTPVVVPNRDGSFTIFFSHLQELLKAAVDLSQKSGEKISVLNLNAHGMPGGTWFPKDAAEKNSPACKDWVDAASNSDDQNYKQYYSAIPKTAIMQMRAVSKKTGGHYGCTVGAPEWAEQIAAVPAIKNVLSNDFQLHFLSCVVGMGPRGDAFAHALAKALLTNPEQKIQTSLQYGLGDWSMPEGMGFWDFQDNAQLRRDNRNYPVNRQDREQMQKGTIRVTSLAGTLGLIDGIDFMYLAQDNRKATPATMVEVANEGLAPESIQLPGTNVILRRR